MCQGVLLNRIVVSDVRAVVHDAGGFHRVVGECPLCLALGSQSPALAGRLAMRWLGGDCQGSKVVRSSGVGGPVRPRPLIPERRHSLTIERSGKDGKWGMSGRGLGSFPRASANAR